MALTPGPGPWAPPPGGMVKGVSSPLKPYMRPQRPKPPMSSTPAFKPPQMPGGTDPPEFQMKPTLGGPMPPMGQGGDNSPPWLSSQAPGMGQTKPPWGPPDPGFMDPNYIPQGPPWLSSQAPSPQGGMGGPGGGDPWQYGNSPLPPFMRPYMSQKQALMSLMGGSGGGMDPNQMRPGPWMKPQGSYTGGNYNPTTRPYQY